MNDTSNNQETTHFGYEEVPMEEKQEKVGQVFRSVANRYDVMNDIMSFGLHRLWKKQFIRLCNIKSQKKVLDIACGTGDIALELIKLIIPTEVSKEKANEIYEILKNRDY